MGPQAGRWLRVHCGMFHSVRDAPVSHPRALRSEAGLAWRMRELAGGMRVDSPETGVSIDRKEEAWGSQQ